MISILNSIKGIIDKVIPDANKRVEVKEKIVDAFLDVDKEYLKAIVQIQTSSSGVKWIDGLKHLIRPIVTLMVMGRLLQSWIMGTEISSNEWLMIQIVVGFYFVSRGAEKMIKKIL
jgi:predicted component of type VI protein secretion system